METRNNELKGMTIQTVVEMAQHISTGRTMLLVSHPEENDGMVRVQFVNDKGQIQNAELPYSELQPLPEEF